jgi:hypothetical protein
VKLPELVTVPPRVVIPIFPLLAPVGTVAVTFPLEFTVNVVAATPPNVTFEVWLRLPPVIATEVPTVPLVGVKLLMEGVTRNILLLTSAPPGVVTVTKPVVAPLGTVAEIDVSLVTVNVAVVPLNDTAVVPVKPCPRISMEVLTLAEFGSRLANGVRPGTLKL